jgi:hypothetical protein
MGKFPRKRVLESIRFHQSIFQAVLESDEIHPIDQDIEKMLSRATKPATEAVAVLSALHVLAKKLEAQSQRDPGLLTAFKSEIAKILALNYQLYLNFNPYEIGWESPDDIPDLGFLDVGKQLERITAEIERLGLPKAATQECLVGILRNLSLDQAASLSPALLRARLRTTTKKERQALLDLRYAKRTSWNGLVARLTSDPTPEDFKKWADGNFPDRKIIGLVSSDLIHLDESAYTKVANWRRTKPERIPPDEFDFPHQSRVVDELLEKEGAPTATDLSQAIRGGNPIAPDIARLHRAARRRGYPTRRPK